MKVDKIFVKKKVKKIKIMKFMRNIIFRVSNEEKFVVENYDKFGEKEEKLREEKLNKFRFDKLLMICKFKVKEKFQVIKKV